jgi:hypothetical protein|tara:strand:+ start:7144 stop:7479 length:336 start_codon:yes stop_codon:yes gene_type:complete
MAATPSTNIIIPQGADFEEIFTSKETDGSSSNLDGFTGVSKLKKHPTSVKSFGFTVGITSATGKVSIAMTSGETVKISPGRYNYDVFLTSPSGAVSRMVEGQAIVTAGIST